MSKVPFQTNHFFARSYLDLGIIILLGYHFVKLGMQGRRSCIYLPSDNDAGRPLLLGMIGDGMERI